MGIFNFGGIFEKPRSLSEDEKTFQEVTPHLERLDALLAEADLLSGDPDILRAKLIDIESLYALVVEKLKQTAYGEQYFREEEKVQNLAEESEASHVYRGTPLRGFHVYKMRIKKLERLLENQRAGNGAEMND